MTDQPTLSDLVQQKLADMKTGTTNKATKSQVEARLKDLRKSLDRRLRAIRSESVQRQKAVAEDFAEEAERIGRDHGFDVDAYAWPTTLTKSTGYTIHYKVKKK